MIIRIQLMFQEIMFLVSEFESEFFAFSRLLLLVVLDFIIPYNQVQLIYIWRGLHRRDLLPPRDRTLSSTPLDRQYIPLSFPFKLLLIPKHLKTPSSLPSLTFHRHMTNIPFRFPRPPPPPLHLLL